MSFDARKRPGAVSVPRSALLPLGALAAGVGLSLLSPVVMAQADTSQTAVEASLPNVTVKAKADKTPEAKQSYQATTTSVGKGKQAIRDIPQSMTVVTEKLMDDRNLDDFKELLRTTAGITFQAGETGEEDVRLRGFSLSQAGDIYIDGMRDASLYERDTFNNDRVEVLKGSASMLFGRGSTGGIVNQVSKQPFLMDQHEVEAMVGTGNEWRLGGDFNLKTGESAALRINAMVQEGDHSGATVSKKGIAPTFRWGIGTADEFSVGLFHLEYDNNPIYNHPWFPVDGKIVPTLGANNFYGLSSDYNKGEATYGTFSHLHRFDDGGELKTTVRRGHYERELWATVIGFGTTNGATTTVDNLSDATVILRRGSKGRIALTNGTAVQSDYSNKFNWGATRHNLLTGVDFSKDDAKRANNYPDRSGVTRPATTVGSANDGASIVDTRLPAVFNDFTARNLGLYAQDTITITPEFKLIAGLRQDQFKAEYETATGVKFSRSDRLWSRRFGALYQPTDWASYHVSYGTSFNTSGDTYQFAVQGPSTKDANTPAEKSRNFEIGAKFDLMDQRLSFNPSVFYSEKYNERNTDPDSAATQQLLSGKRHALGLDLDVSGQITPKWEGYLSYTWIPVAKIDESNVAAQNCNVNTGVCTPNNAQRKGDRPGLTPKHSASIWTTYAVAPQWRVGGGINYRGTQNPEGARQIRARDFATLDLMAEYQINPKTSLKLNVTNATDELYADSLYRGFYAPGAARAAQLTLKTTF